ncbi:DUF3298 and DUF4163 domain-containing protein [Henriciella aquimarina]|uniref:DUF3298 and DUF4163 domain-containing protein n=1 Tax=Henriciella aquimarina TaxID=545261 RepID=UPI000A060BC3|nr:DUF3298 and DUF4163 domain-containing protein [Henriciella aquimarina]
MLAMTGCGAEQADAPQPPEASSSAKGTDASTDELFDTDPKVAVVNGEQAATIDISLPDDIEELHPALAEEIRKRANRGTEAFIAAAQADKEAAAEKGFEFRPHSLDVNWIEVGPPEGHLAGFLGTYATYTGGAHPNVGFDVLNWDRNGEKVMTFEDFFADVETARTKVTIALKEGLLEAKRERLKDTNFNEQDMLESWVNPAFADNSGMYQGFTIARSSEADKAGGLIYHFAPYEVGAYAEGVYEVGVPYEAFADVLKADYEDAFGGTPVLP